MRPRAVRRHEPILPGDDHHGRHTGAGRDLPAVEAGVGPAGRAEGSRMAAFELVHRFEWPEVAAHARNRQPRQYHGHRRVLRPVGGRLSDDEMRK